MEVARVWCKEFYRLREKIFYNLQEIEEKEDFNENLDILAKNLENFNVKDYVFLREKVKFSNLHT